MVTNEIYALKGYCHNNFAASRKICGEIMTQNLYSKQETLLQPQEEDIERFFKGEQTSVLFWRYFPLTMKKLENVRITFSSCSPHLTASPLANGFSSLINHFYAKQDHCLQIVTAIKTYPLAFHVLQKFRDSAPLKYLILFPSPSVNEFLIIETLFQ